MGTKVAHTSSRMPRVACIAFLCGSNACKNGRRREEVHQGILTYIVSDVGDRKTRG